MRVIHVLSFALFLSTAACVESPVDDASHVPDEAAMKRYTEEAASSALSFDDEPQAPGVTERRTVCPASSGGNTCCTVNSDGEEPFLFCCVWQPTGVICS